MHLIRLRRPWHKSPLGGSVQEKVDVPETKIAGHAQVGQTFCYRRSFNRPSGLQPSSRVYLRVDAWEGRLDSATLNGSVLKVGDSARIDVAITHLLATHNEIELCISSLSDQAARLSGEVTLAIDEAGD